MSSYLSAADKTKAYRAKLRDTLGDEEYLRIQREKKREQRLRAKTKNVQYNNDVSLPSVDIKNLQEEIKIIRDELNKLTKQELNIIQKIVEAPQVQQKENPNIVTLHKKYSNKVLSESTINNYISKMGIVIKMFVKKDLDEKIDVSNITSDLRKLLENKKYNKDLINKLNIFRNINEVIQMLKDKYINKTSLSGYINAVTSILGRIPEFRAEYEIISQINIDLSKDYERQRDTNDAPDETIDKLISFDDNYINQTIKSISNISDKALFAVYTIIPPRRIKDYQLMKIKDIKDIDVLDPKYNYLILENTKPSFFVFYNHKTAKSKPEQKITLPKKLISILYDYISSNEITINDFLFGRPNDDYKKNYIQSKFTERIQDVFLKYTGKKISVDLIRTSKSTYLDNQKMSIGQRKEVARDMAHSLGVHLQYSKNQGVDRMKKKGKNPISTDVVEKTAPEIRRKLSRRAKKALNYEEL